MNRMWMLILGGVAVTAVAGGILLTGAPDQPATDRAGSNVGATTPRAPGTGSTGRDEDGPTILGATPASDAAMFSRPSLDRDGSSSAGAFELARRNEPLRAEAPRRSEESSIPSRSRNRSRPSRSGDGADRATSSGTTTSTGTARDPRRGIDRSTRTSEEARQAALEQRRQELAERRRQALEQAQARAARRQTEMSQASAAAGSTGGVSGGTGAFGGTGAADGSTGNGSEGAGSGNNGATGDGAGQGDGSGSASGDAGYDGLNLDSIMNGNQGNSGDGGSGNSGNGNNGNNNAGGGFTTTGEGTVGEATAVWVPVPNNVDPECEEVAGFRTNDLFLRFERQGGVIAVQSGDAASGAAPLTITNGEFFQSPEGGDLPNSRNPESFPCAPFDTFLDLGGQADQVIHPTGGTITFQPEVVAAVFSFNQTGAPAVRDGSRFPDGEGFFIRVGRFTASLGSSVKGTLEVTAVPNGAVLPEIVEVSIPNCAECWSNDSRFNAPAPPPEDEGGDPDDDGSNGQDDGADDDQGDDSGNENADTDEPTDDPDDGDMGDDNGDDEPGDDDPDGDEGDDDQSGGQEDEGEEEPEPLACDELSSRLTLVWKPVEGGCPELQAIDPDGFGYQTNDLFLRADAPFNVIGVLSPVCRDPISGVTELCFDNGQPVQPLTIEHLPPNQDPFSTGFFQLPPPEGTATLITPASLRQTLFEQVVCLEDDSALGLGDDNQATAIRTTGDPLESPSLFEWEVNVNGQLAVDAFWFVTNPTGAPAVQDPSLFGDDAYYLHIARLTAPDHSRVFGALDFTVVLIPEGGGATECPPVLVPIPDDTSLWAPQSP